MRARARQELAAFVIVLAIIGSVVGLLLLQPPTVRHDPWCGNDRGCIRGEALARAHCADWWVEVKKDRSKEVLGRGCK